MTMRRASFVTLALCVVLINHNYAYAKIGYFWHITDFHYDPNYNTQDAPKKQCRKEAERSYGYRRSPGRYGDYHCDTTLALVESATRYMRTRNSENVEFVLWTGDIVSARISKDEQFKAIRTMTDLLRGTFSSHFVFPVLGHTDPQPSETLANLWMNWLPMEALNTFIKGGYYTIEQTASKLRIVVLNTNLFGARASNNSVAQTQWEWLESTLIKTTYNKEMVYIVGHAPPGSNSRPGHNSYSFEANTRYLDMVRRYWRVIAGQFFGHLHADTFRVFYINDYPISWALLAPSLSPRSDPMGSTNPGLRLYKFDINTGKVLDYTQYFLDLEAANSEAGGYWTPEYNLTQYYGLQDVSAFSLHNIADKLRYTFPQNSATFHKYLKAYNVKHTSVETCDNACAHQHFCAISCVDHPAYRQCVDAAASALAAAGAGSSACSVTATAKLIRCFDTIIIAVVCLKVLIHAGFVV